MGRLEKKDLASDEENETAKILREKLRRNCQRLLNAQPTKEKCRC